MRNKTGNNTIERTLSALLLAIVLIFSFSPVLALTYPTEALAASTASNDNTNAEEPESPYMTDLDFSNFANAENGGTAQANLLSGGTEMMQIIVNAVLLPLSIIVCAWRSVYLAVFPLLAHTDPLNLMSSEGGRALSHNRATPLNSNGRSFNNEDVIKLLKTELVNMGKGLIVVMCVWGFIQIIMWIIVFLVGALH